MTDISVIILAGKEELHIRRCLERIAPLEPKQVIVVESQKGDRTHEIAVETGRCLNWRISECLNDGIGECLNEKEERLDRRALAQRKKSPPPKFRPLTEVVETVAKHQAAGFSPLTMKSSVANPPSPRKGGSESSTLQLQLETSTLHAVWHDWPGNQAAQFNWALDYIEGKGKSEKGKSVEGGSSWILRLDADEYLTDALIARIKAFVAAAPDDVDLVQLRLGRTWQGRRVRFGMPPKYIPRLFRLGVCRYGDQVMDERLEADPARTIRWKEMFIDDNLNSFDWWREKHIGYMKREAQKAVSGAHGNKGLYYKMPPYLRAIGYWAVRYFVFGGFLDGRAGWSWNWWQGLWYRWQVDREIGRLEREKRAENRE